MELSRKEVYSGVEGILRETLGLEDGEINPDDRLVYDLRVESIDLLEIIFELEKKFDLKIPRVEFIPFGDSPNDPFYQEIPLDSDSPSKLNVRAVEHLKIKHPHVDFSGLDERNYLDDVQRRITVDSIVNYVHRRLFEKSCEENALSEYLGVREDPLIDTEIDYCDYRGVKIPDCLESRKA